MSTFRDVDRLMEHFLEVGPVGCCLAVTQGEDTIYEKYFGTADGAGTTPLAPEHVFRQYSMTKVLAAICGLIQLERGAFLLNDPISAYLPEYKHMQVQVQREDGSFDTVESKTPITLRHAFSMSVGMMGAPDTLTGQRYREVHEKLGGNKILNAYDHLTEVRAMAEIPMLWEPGTSWQYSVGLELMTAVVEVTSGMKLADFMQKEIFDPLGMKDSGYHFKGDMADRLVDCTQRNAEGKAEKLVADFMEDRSYQPDFIYQCASTGVLSTLPDYTKFAKMLANGGRLGDVRIVGRKSIDLLRRNQLSDQQLFDMHNRSLFTGSNYLKGYGYGMGVRTMLDPALGGSNGSVGEFGWCGMMGTYLSVDPDEKTSIVYMHQIMPNMEEYTHLRLRSVVNGLFK